MNYISHYNSPLGSITLASDGYALVGLWFDGQKHFGSTLGDEYEEKPLPVFDRTAAWLDIYFDGRIPDFTPKIALNDTDFRREVWNILLNIPYGQTMTYGEIAAIIAQKRGAASISAQAVGGAVGRNPISIIIPCHRVIGRRAPTGKFRPTVSVNDSHCRTINFTSSRQLTSVNGSLTGYAGGIERKAALLRLEGIAVLK
ncbi:MAG: methylated-DNA--[Clostridia bacterium]|nr:methylated-DNA--[protein]-cysteine S-methyltransferase [Clostridia bacterium]